MPFLLYEVSKDEVCTNTQRHWKLFGYLNGLIYKSVEAQLNARKDFTWTRTSDELLQGAKYPHSNALVIDLAPKRDRPLMGRVCGAAGFTNCKWTPFVLFLKVVELASKEEKEQINFGNGDRACTILYANGGWNRGHDGNWNRFGGQGLSAAILWCRAFQHIMKIGQRWVENGVVVAETQFTD